MLFLVLIISIILSLTPWSPTIEKFLLMKRKYISLFFLVISALSLLLIFDQTWVKDSWEQTIATLWFLLFLPICARVFSLGIPAKWMMYRKEIGILMGTLALVHSSQYFLWTWGFTQIFGRDFWIMDGSFRFLGAWFIALVISTLLLMTSNGWAVNIMWMKYWKLLHRSVYVLVLFAVIHVVLLTWEMTGFIILGVYLIGKILEWRWIVLRKAPRKNPA